ncbi:FecR family protein [Dysgonomonas termitidis]|uniref:FecR family protein n=1 Tax=Dysgonomonas termitidis TaxID=1516126 RepID=A0ABV9L4G4_9BACT
MDPKVIVEKIFKDDLTEKEQADLLHSPSVTTQMSKQWDDAPESADTDGIDEQTLWETIKANTIEKAYQPERGRHKFSFYKIYSVAASVLIIIGLGLFTYLKPDRIVREEVYIVHSGHQDISLVILPDSTQVKMGPGSKLTYPKQFSGKSREVTLYGQGFFDVKKNREKPFIVHTPQMDVVALGTAFEIFNYDGNNKIETILLNGKVKISYPEKANPEPVYLSPNEKMTYNRANKSVTVEKVDAAKYTSWHEQDILNFENETLAMILPRLEQWFGCKISCPENVANHYRFTFKVRDESIERIFDMMKKSTPVRYRKTGNTGYQIYIK